MWGGGAPAAGVTSAAAGDGHAEHCDNSTFQVDRWGSSLTNASAWNYGLNVESLAFEQVSDTPAAVPFSTAGSPVVIRAQARQVAWGTVRGSAAAPPKSPVASSAPIETLALIPYGATHGLSMVELPTL